MTDENRKFLRPAKRTKNKDAGLGFRELPKAQLESRQFLAS